jgi:hypothetical protein
VKRRDAARHSKARREQLDGLIAVVRAAGPLEGPEWLLALRVLEEVRDGYDPRAYFGIAPKSGRRPSTIGWQKWMAIHFLKLVEEQPDVLAKVHADDVATAWGVSPGTVRNNSSKHGEDVPVAFVTLQQCEDFATIFREKPRIHRNPRRMR